MADIVDFQEIETPASFKKFIPFWFFLIFFKFAAGLHYSLISPLGEKLYPLWIVGLLMGGCSFVQALLDVPAGHWLDRFGYRRLLKVTTIVFGIAVLFLFYGLTKETYLLSLLFSIGGWLFFGPGINAYILSHAPKTNSGQFISFRDIFSSLGIVFSSLALIPLVNFSAPQIALTLIFLFAIAFVMLVCSPKDKHVVHEEIKILTQHHYIHRVSLKNILKSIKTLNPASTMLLLLSITGATFYGVIWFVVPLVMAQQVHTEILGIGLGTFDFAIVVLGFVLGNLADTLNKKVLIFIGLLLFSLAGMALGFDFGWLFVIFGFVSTAGDEMAGISLWSWLYNLDQDHANDGLVAGIIKFFEDLGWAIGPIIAGVLYTIVGPSLTIVYSAIPILIVWAIYQILIRVYKEQTVEIAGVQVPVKPHRRRHKN